MKPKIPDKIFGVEVKGAIERVLSNPNSKPINIPNNTQLPKKDNFIYVPSIGLYVSKEKSLFNHNWYKTHEELEKLNLRMYNPSEAKTFLDYLLNNQKSGTLDASSSEIEKILDEILEKRDSWRGEHIDAYFKQKKNGLYILTKNKTNSERLGPCVMEDCYVELDSFNWQGFPTKKSKVQEYKKGENIYSWHPRNGAVARFNAGSDVADFDCSRVPSYSGASLGVRPCAEGTAPKN